MSSPAVMSPHRLAGGECGLGAREGVQEAGLWPLCCPGDTRPHTGYFSFLALVACLSREQTEPEARSEPQGRASKIKMRKRPRADAKEPPGKCQVWSGISEHILAESLRVQTTC